MDVAAPATVDLLRVSMLDTGGKSAGELRAMVDQAIAQRGWLVLLFHGVGSETACPNLDYNPAGCMINYLTTSVPAHDALVSYLDQQKARVWTATFKDAAQRLQARRR